MTGEIKKDMCGRTDCELCQLLNELFSEPRLESEIKPLNGRYQKYARLFNH